jgi:hypothetical protein
MLCRQAVGKFRWRNRPHEGLRSPHIPSRDLTPDEAYAVQVARAGYLPVPLAGEDYIELLPACWRAINEYGIVIGHRTYDCPELGPYRRKASPVTAMRGRWEVHYDPLSRPCDSGSYADLGVIPMFVFPGRSGSAGGWHNAGGGYSRPGAVRLSRKPRTVSLGW